MRVTVISRQKQKHKKKYELFYQGDEIIIRVHAHIDVITCVTLFIGYAKWCMASDCMVLYLHLRSFETEKTSLKQKEMECIE